MRRVMNILWGVAIIQIIISLSGCEKNDIEPLIVDPIDIDLKTDRLRGFNIQGLYNAETVSPGFLESDFQMINEFGFNFARIPLDYRTYTEFGDWNKFIESQLAKIDEVIEFGSKYKIHINLNLHRAPGYCVNQADYLHPDQDTDLWTDPIAQEIFLKHWEMFAKRYKEVPPSVLSFNLINEPNNVSSSVYADLCKRAINVIEEYNSNRVIHIDGINNAHNPVLELLDEPNVVHSVHNYDPSNLTHYQAGWVTGSHLWPTPNWPVLEISNGLFGSWKPDLEGPFIVEGSFKQNAVVTINIRQVSVYAEFNISLDDNVLFTKTFEPSSGLGEWESVVHTEHGYQNFYNKDYSVTLPSDGNNLKFYIAEGDWLTFNKITIATTTDTIELLPGNTSWGIEPSPIKIASNGEIQTPDGNSAVMGCPLLDDWYDFSITNNTNIFIGECGVYNRTPHDVTLRYMEDMLKIMKDYNMSYALWDFRGSFGIIDSNRAGVEYEDYQGYELDREYLELLQKY